MASRLFIFIGLASSIARVISGRLCNQKSVNPVYIYQVSMMLACISAFLLPFSTKYWQLIVFSVVYGLSDGIFITTQCFILLSCVDAKRVTASFCINNVIYSFAATAGGPIAGKLLMLNLQLSMEQWRGKGVKWVFLKWFELRAGISLVLRSHRERPFSVKDYLQ